jgi:hypothetical protein
LAQLYPAVGTLGYPKNLQFLYPVVVKALVSIAVAPVPVLVAKPEVGQLDDSLATRPAVQRKTYPVFDLYPAVYPHNLLEIYPSVLVPTRAVPANRDAALVKEERKMVLPLQTKALDNVQVRLAARYPTLDLFPPVYPYNLERIYPASAKPAASSVATLPKSGPPAQVPTAKLVHTAPMPLIGTAVHLARVYPNIELYAPVYPFNLDIYPATGVKGWGVAPKDVGLNSEVTVVAVASRDLGML